MGAGVPAFAAEDGPQGKRRVGVIGHTGRGNYGHGLDTVWLKIPEVGIVGVADPDDRGMQLAMRRLKTGRGFRDYRRLLKEGEPEFVSICSRYADQHAEIIIACAEAGVKGIYVEKPFCRTPAEADRIREACQKHGTKVAVAHRNRYNPVLSMIAKLVEEGEIGKLLEIRGRGKGDRRGGAEDLWVLGSHVMDMIRFFGGHAVNCSAEMLKDGSPVTWKDVYEGAEGLGLLAGHELHARYRMSNGVIATFDSIAEDQTSNWGFGLQLIGSNGIIAIRADRDPLAHIIRGNPFMPPKEPRKWTPITTAGVGQKEDKPELIKDIHEHVVAVKDLIAAVDEPVRHLICGLEQGAGTVEMICAVFESHRRGGKAVSFPLEERGNPLEKFRREGRKRAQEAGKEPQEAAAKVGAYPVAVPVPGKPGFAFNPFNPKSEVDLRAIPPGTLVRDPKDPDPKHKFRVP